MAGRRSPGRHPRHRAGAAARTRPHPALLADLGGLGDAAPGLVAALAGLSGGWPALVGLALDEISRAGPGCEEAALAASFGPGGAALTYVEAAVLSPLSPGQRALLRVLARLGATPVAALASVEPVGREVDGLARRHLVTVEDGAGGTAVARLPDVLGEAFVRTLRSSPPDGDEQAVLRMLVEVHRSREDPGAELDVLTAMRDDDAIAALLRRSGGELLRSGRVSELVRRIKELPDHEVDPAIRLLEAEAHQVLGDHETALACFERLATGDGPLTPGLAWRLGVSHYLRGESAEAMACYRRGRLGAEDSPEEAQLLAWMASVEWLGGDADSCADHAQRAMRAARLCGDSSALAAAHVASALHAGLVGSRRDLNEHYDQAFDHAQRAGDRLQLVRVCTNRGSHLIDEGHLDRALADLELARETAARAHFRAFEALCGINLAEAHLRLGELDAAEEAYVEAQALYQHLGSRKIAYALNGLGAVHLLRGAPSLARSAFTEALEVSDSGEDIQALGPALCGLAGVLARRDPEAAAGYARRAEALPGPTRTRALLTLGWLHLRTDPQEAADVAARAEAEARRHRDWMGLAESQELQGMLQDGAARMRLWRQAELAWRRSGSTLGEIRLRFARGVLEGAGAAPERLTLAGFGVETEAPPGLGLLPEVAPHSRVLLEIRTLGGFELRHRGRPVAGPLSQSRKARDLLKILVARDGPVPREALMEELWPGEDLERLHNRLSVAVRAIRRSADPAHDHPQDWVLVAAAESLALDPRHVRVDAWEFLAAAEAALGIAHQATLGRGKPAIEAALALYGGEFLPDEPYADWAAPLRERVCVALQRCRASLGDHPATQLEPTAPRERRPLRSGSSPGRGSG